MDAMETNGVDAREPTATTRGEEDATTASGGDETKSGKFRAAAETPETVLPLRVLDEYEFRDKFNESKLVSVHGSKPCEVLVLGKARKIEGGESELPSKVLAETLTPQDKPPHALKLMEVHDWVIRYGGDAPEIWLVTPRAWYKLLEPNVRFEKYVATTLRRARFVNAVVRALAENWNVELERGLEIILSVPVVPHDVPMAIKTPTKAARLLGDTSPEAQREAALDGRSEEEAKDSSAYRYTRADVVVDGFFIASQIETLVKSGALRPTGAPAFTPALDADLPPFVVDLQTWTSDKHQLGTSTKASRLERDRARRERLRAEKQAEKEAKNKPRPPRLEPPPPASRVLSAHSARVGPALLAETLTLWDFSQVFARSLHFPRCPLDRFARAFLGDDLTAAESAVLRDFMTACLRVVEGRVDSIDHETMKKPPERARWWTDPVMGINDIGELDWEDRATHLIVEYERGINGRARAHAVRAVEALEAGRRIEDAPPTGRVSLAVALCAMASESEAFREYFTEVYDATRERRKKGEFHVNPPTLAEEVPKTEKTKTKTKTKTAEDDGDGAKDDDAMDTDDVKGVRDGEQGNEEDEEDDDGEVSKPPPTLAEYRREQLATWRAESVNRSVATRGKPVAVDEHGRRYFALGGLNNACRLFVETPPDGWLDDDDAPPIVDGKETPRRPETRPPVDDVAYEEDLEDAPSASGNVSGLREYASRWGVYEPGESLDALSAWCDASYDNERFITKLHRLVSNAFDGADAEPPLEPSIRLERIKALCDSMSVDAYAHLESVSMDTADERTRAVRLFETVKFIAHSAPFWRTGDTRWTDRFIRVTSRVDAVCSAEEPSLIDLLKILSGIESVFSQANLMDDTGWTEMKPTWLAQLRFYVYGPRTEDELAGAAPRETTTPSTPSTTTTSGENIPGLNDVFTAPELLEPLPPLTVRRAANLVNQFLRYVTQDSHRMSQRAFQLSTGIEHGVAAIQPGDIVALIRRGLSKTYAKYVERKSRPRTWIDVNSLQPVERCAVLGVAYRGCEEARRRAGEVNPPCAWFMCLLLDEPGTERQSSTRSRNSADAVKIEEKDERRIVMAPLYAGDIAEYVLPWSKYQEVDKKPWQAGNRIMMQFEGVQVADESRGIVTVDGAVYYLGRVRKTRASPDRWESVMVVFDSDPEDYMWVSPWEIVEAPEKYHEPVHMPPEPVDIWKSLTPEDMAHIARCKAVARRLGWPSGDHRKDFEQFREEAFGHGDMPLAPVFCGTRMNLHRVFIETLHLGGYEQVTRAKFWKTVARSLGRDLTSQTSASFAMRRSYERCLYPMETYLTSAEMVEKLGLVVNEEATTMDQFPGSLPCGVAHDDYDDEEDNHHDDEEVDDDDDEEVDNEMDDANDEEAKVNKDGGDDYKLSDEDFDDEDGSDDGESDSDWK